MDKHRNNGRVGECWAVPIRSLRPYLSFSTTLLSSVTVTPSTTTEQYEPLVVWRSFYGFTGGLTIGIGLWYHFWTTANFTVRQDDEWTLPWPTLSLSFRVLHTLMKQTEAANKNVNNHESLCETPYMDKYRNTNRVGGCFTVRNVLYNPINRSRLRCCPRSPPIRQWEQNINIIDNITR